MFIEWTPYCMLTLLVLCGYIHGQCPGSREPVCSSCVNDTAVCSRACIGNSSYSKNYLTQICTGHDNVIRNVDLSYNVLDHLDCTTSIQLRTINISNNNITIDDCSYWEKNCFNAMRYLEYIDLSFNRIKNSCNASAFPLNKLKHVNLSYNRVTSLDNLPFFSSANEIRVVDLSHNYISYLSWDLFLNKPDLVSVNISYNNFQQLCICHNLVPESTRIFDIRIYKTNASDLNGTIFSNDTQRQFTHTHRFVVSISEVDFNLSVCYKDVHCNVSDDGLLFQLLNDSKTSNQLDINTCMHKSSIPCYVEEFGATHLLTDITTTQLTSLDKETVSPSAETTSSENASITSTVTTKKCSSNLSELCFLLPVVGVAAVFSLCFLFFLGLFSLKLLQIIKERQYSQRLKYSVNDDIYAEINTNLRNVTKILDYGDRTDLSSWDITREECYNDIPELEGSSSLSPSTASNAEGSVDHYEAPNLVEGYHHRKSEHGDTSSNVICRNDKLGLINVSTESMGGSVCYYTLASSCEDIDKDEYGVNSGYAGEEGDDLRQGSHTYENPFLSEMSNCSKLAKESTVRVYEASCDNGNCFTYSMKTGQCKNVKSYKENSDILDPNVNVEENVPSCHKSGSLDMLNNPCYMEINDDMDQNIATGEDALDREKCTSLDMLTNACYASTSLQMDNLENSQSNSELSILNDQDPSRESHNYDQSFLLQKLENSIVLETPFDDNNGNDSSETTDICRIKGQRSSQEKVVSTQEVDVNDDIVNEDEIETPEMVMNPWYKSITFKNESQSSNESEVKEIQFDQGITNTEDCEMLRNPCYMPVKVDSEYDDTEQTSEAVDSSLIPNMNDDPFDSEAAKNSSFP